MQNASLRYKHLLSLALLLTIAAPGCSWQRSAQNMPPATYGDRDDVQFFPAGTEDTLYP